MIQTQLDADKTLSNDVQNGIVCHHAELYRNGKAQRHLCRAEQALKMMMNSESGEEILRHLTELEKGHIKDPELKMLIEREIGQKLRLMFNIDAHE